MFPLGQRYMLRLTSPCQLPTDFTWKKLKYLARKGAPNLGWTEMAFTDEREGRNRGWIRVKYQNEAYNLYGESVLCSELIPSLDGSRLPQKRPSSKQAIACVPVVDNEISSATGSL